MKNFCFPYQQGPPESTLICNAGAVFVIPQNGASLRIFNYCWFTLVRVNFPHYGEIYIKGYWDTHPINVLLMFQLSFCKMLRGEIREQLKWFISDTDMHWKEQKEGLQPYIPSIQNSLSPVLLSDSPSSFRLTDLCRCCDLILSKGLAAALASLCPTIPIHSNLEVHHGI